MVFKKIKFIGATVTGTALEFYDFTLYGVFAVVLAERFFPNSDPYISLLSSLALYATGSFMKPLGGLIFGWIGDQKGRKPALVLSSSLMAASTTMVGLLPTYDQIGLLAPLALVICRLLQGLSAGGEFNNACIFSIEHAGSSKAGLSGGLVVAGATVGTFVAMTLSFFVLKAFPENGWRIPFLLGALIGICAAYIRRFLDESPAYNKDTLQINLFHVLRENLWKQHKSSLLRAITIGGFASALGFTVFNYINIYLNTYVNFHITKSMLFNAFGLGLFILLTPCMGFLADKWGAKKLMLASCSLTTLSIFSIYGLLSSGDTTNILLAQVWLVCLSSSFSGSMNVLLMRMFPPKIRCVGISFGFGLGVAIFGGTLPFISSLLITSTENILAPAYYLIGCGLMVFVTLLTIKSTKEVDVCK